MTRNNSYLAWGLIVFLSIFLQILFIFEDSKNTATKTVIEFSKAYFLIDSNLNKYVSSKLINNDYNIAKKYVTYMIDEASELGMSIHSVKRFLYKIETETLHQNSKFAKIRIKALSKASINPLFFWISSIFKLGKTTHIDNTIILIKENGEWKIDGNPFKLCTHNNK